MKQLTDPDGWIGVLIGIIVFGSIVGHVTSQRKCLAASGGTVKDTTTTITTELTVSGYSTACGDGSHYCLQYYPPLKANADARKGKGKAIAECGANCVANHATLGAGYQCSPCDTSNATSIAASCKTLDSIKADLIECYSVDQKAKNSLDKTQTKHFCMDECHYYFDASQNKLTVGCKEDIKGIPASGGTKPCPPGDLMCEQMIIQNQFNCFQVTGTKLETVAEIDKAVARENWKAKCTGTDKCLVYYPPSVGNDKKGKAMVLVECGATCGNAATKVSTGYQCSACDPVDPSTCQKFDKSTLTECITYIGKKNDLDLVKVENKIYCMDKCQYSEVENVLHVGCADELKGKGKPADCPGDDKFCENMVLKSKKGGGGEPTNNQGATASPTPATKHGNRVAVPTCLIGSMTILFFAASQYVTILN